MWKFWWCRNILSSRPIGLLVEGAKVVAEGAGAAGVAALLAYTEHFRGRRVGIAITGGNIDARILSNVLLRNLLRDGRLLRLHLQIPDRPGVLADIAGQDRQHRRQHHRGVAPAPVRRIIGAGGGAGGDGGGARSVARRCDTRGVGEVVCRAAGVRCGGGLRCAYPPYEPRGRAQSAECRQFPSARIIGLMPPAIPRTPSRWK